MCCRVSSLLQKLGNLPQTAGLDLAQGVWDLNFSLLKANEEISTMCVFAPLVTNCSGDKALTSDIS